MCVHSKGEERRGANEVCVYTLKARKGEGLMMVPITCNGEDRRGAKEMHACTLQRRGYPMGLGGEYIIIYTIRRGWESGPVGVGCRGGLGLFRCGVRPGKLIINGVSSNRKGSDVSRKYLTQCVH